ncbi:alpha-amylase family glycosyl hydrolase [Mucilaginibacter kameinonensis]|uniref:alpha-amylase family glycosyl hydrolase n=1 Tax=Mucilaginibacter kameinonensis TaxID=452286 RepID=UPI000EF762CC|nr:alpha-amylase family glycosyl hydrolase [Mucilaginibacter kameinonensis]
MRFRSKFKLYRVLLIAVLSGATIAGCGKSKTDTPVVPPPVTDTNTDPVQYGTPFGSVPATKDIVMYEVNIKTYAPANFDGVKARLDSIKALGVNVIWLMPTYPIGVVKASGSPYAVKDYEGVNPEFGSLDDLRSLVARAHTLGMAVILDWEANDTSWDNAWITQHPSWYQQDANGNIKQLSTYSDVAALNFNSADMRDAMIKAMKYWVYTANVDGFRCDFADNAPSDFWTQAIGELKKITTHKLIYLAEGTNGSEITDGFQLGYAFNFYSTIKSVFAGGQAGNLFTTNAAELASLPSPGIKLRYITNHDNASSDGSTITEYGGKQGALAAFVLASYMGGVPLIYSSQEVGYPNAINFFNTVPVDYTANPDMVAAYKKILAFRAAHEAVKTGSLTQYNDTNVAAFEKVSGTDDVLVLVNTRNNSVPFNIPAPLQNTTWIDGMSGGTTTLSSQITLQPYSYLVLKKR